MKIHFNLDKNYKELNVELLKNVIDDEVQQIIQLLENSNSSSTEKLNKLMGYQEKNIFPLEFCDIYRIYSDNNKVYATTTKEEYNIKHRLYELETILDEETFLRISNSEFINVTKIKKFDLNLAGTIKIHLKNNSTAFVSRRYVGKIKEFFKLWGDYYEN